MCHFSESSIILAAANFENILDKPWFTSSKEDQCAQFGRVHTATSKEENLICRKNYRNLMRRSKTQLFFLAETLVRHDNLFSVEINSSFLQFYVHVRPMFTSLMYRKNGKIRIHNHSHLCKYSNLCSKQNRKKYVMVCGINSLESLALVTTVFGCYISSISCHDLCLGGSFANFKISLFHHLEKIMRKNAVLYLRNLDVLENNFQGIQRDEIGEIFHESITKFFRHRDSAFDNEPSLVVLTNSQSSKESKLLNSGIGIVDLFSFRHNFLTSSVFTKKNLLKEAEHHDRFDGSNEVRKNELISFRIAKRFQSSNVDFMLWNPVELGGMVFVSEFHDNAKEIIEKKVHKKCGKSHISKFPMKNWTDVGGLDSIKIMLKSMLNLSVKYQNLIPCTGSRKKGILFYGPPGTGKTLLARVIASEISSHFMNIKGPEIMDMYVGESEKHIREIFEEAKKYRPSVIFFDELDALAQSRPYYSENVSSSTRVVSQLLTEVDDLTQYDNIFIIGATNRPDLIEPALLRPGRFETPIFIGVNSSNVGRQRVLQALTKGFKFSDIFTFEEVSERISDLLTGADIYAVCVGAWLKAAKRACLKNCEEGYASDEIRVKERDFILTLEDTFPSLRNEDLTRYNEIEKSFRKFFVND